MPAVDRAAFLGAMRRVASSVTVVTTDGPAGRHGATVSAFCSVSADPPTVLVCLNDSSRTAACVRGNGAFAVNVLPEDAPKVAMRFAGRGAPADRFEGLDCTPGALPLIAGATALICGVTEAPLCGTHRVVMGEVTQVRLGAAAALAYHDGAFGRVVPLDAAGRAR